jgi:WD40 repeat protein
LPGRRHHGEAPGPRPSLIGELQELSGHTSARTCKTVNWFGNFVVSGSDNGTIYFFDPEDAAIVNILRDHAAPVKVVTVHQEKRLLATSGVDDYAILWEPQKVADTDMTKVGKSVADIQEEVREIGFDMGECQIM